MKRISKEEYIKLCVINRAAIDEKAWWIKAYAIPTLINEDPKEFKYLDLCLQNDGIYAVDEDNTLMGIDGWKRGEPLFKLTDMIDVDHSVMGNILSPMRIKISRLLINAIVIPKSVEDRFPFINPKGKIDVGVIEGMLGPRVINPEDVKMPDSITVAEYVQMTNNMDFFESLALIINTSATPKSITRAKGITEYRDKLIKEFGDRLRDPVELVKFENLLREYDSKYLADDPVAANVMGRKAGVGRFKMYGIYGAGLDFVKSADNDTLILNSVSDGFNPDPSEIPKYFNDLRYASFSRGSNTALAGTIYKVLQRALAPVTIERTPCNTSKGLVKVLSKHEAKYSIGRFYKDGNVWRAISTKEEADSLIGKEIEMRSPMHCKTEGNRICYACMSTRYKTVPNGVSNLAAEVSDILLNMFLKLMHGVKTDITDIKQEDLIN